MRLIFFFFLPHILVNLRQASHIFSLVRNAFNFSEQGSPPLAKIRATCPHARPSVFADEVELGVENVC